ncbi:MAG: sigma 54-interacting transcriptional regulator [Magnetococcales bacterium]|nr:sigma 54-interacting transcriptional regulator [Magnetococcales bacterium]
MSKMPTSAVGVALESGDFLQDTAVGEKIVNLLLGRVEEGVVILDTQWRVRGMNLAARELTFLGPLAMGRVFAGDREECQEKLRTVLNRIAHTGVGEELIDLSCRNSGNEALKMGLAAIPIGGRGQPFQGVVLLFAEGTRLANLTASRQAAGRFHRLIGGSPVMGEIYAQVENLANVATTVLVTGESGTGKELVAEALHFQGQRSHRPLVRVNCSALSETLLESELFGHVKGAFTGAVRDRIGRFKLADGGTLFLDEIGEISLHMQTRLLRTLQEREFEPVGSSRTVKVDVRIVAATNRDLRKRIKEGAFREDLFYRLNVVEVAIPPLRQRRDDIPLLINHFLRKFNTKYQSNISGVADSVLEVCMTHPWPGNVRELENVIEHAFVTCRRAVIKIKHLPKEFLKGKMPCGDALPPVVQSSDPERDTILRALETTHWKKNLAAKLLGISRSTLYRKMEVFKIQ